ncbi:MAG: NAD(P)-dependent oxidoreductase [Spirochaetes bacterium]|nr:NAD(P)-dependent oxidoreductase [Spirochaetota bacterium]
MINNDYLINNNDLILITGANGFIGSKVVELLCEYGFNNLRCFVRPSGNLTKLKKIITKNKEKSIEIFKGNLLDPDDCNLASKDVKVVYHIAAGVEKSFAGCYLNSVVTTKNLLEAIVHEKKIIRFVNVSSFAVYSNMKIRRGGLLDENCVLETNFVERNEAYAYGKANQDKILLEYNKKYQIPYVIVRPGVVFGPERENISVRIGVDTFGIFMHLGGGNRIPYTYVDNCAEAMILSGLVKGIDGETFNIVDDDLPKSKYFLKQYKKRYRKFKTIKVPYRLFYIFCSLWENYSKKTKGQLPPVFNRRKCSAYWKGNKYSNQKLKKILGWKPRIGMKEALDQYFQSLVNKK